MDEAKRAARKAARTARRGIDPATRSSASEAVAERVLAMPETAQVRTVLTYAAMPEELDPSPLVEGLRARGVAVAYPRVTGPGALSLHWAETASLEPGYWGILEPSADSPEAAIADIELVLVPGAAFDPSCRRLGLGGGFYDRLLADRAPHSFAIGLAFDEQVLDEVPTQAHDVTIDAVATPTRTLRARG